MCRIDHSEIKTQFLAELLPRFYHDYTYIITLFIHVIAMTTVIWNPLLFYWLTRQRKTPAINRSNTNNATHSHGGSMYVRNRMGVSEYNGDSTYIPTNTSQRVPDLCSEFWRMIIF